MRNNKKDSPSIRSLTDEFIRVVRIKNIPLFCFKYSFYEHWTDGVYNKIFEWLSYATVVENPAPSGTWKIVDSKNAIKTKKVFKTAIRMTLSHAIQTFIKAVEDGEFDKNETYRTIFLKETRNDHLLHLFCSRELNSELRLGLSKIKLEGDWDSRIGWFGS